MLNIRLTGPLVHCMTNYVAANLTANGLLAIGASPIMADEIEEAAEMASSANALLINIGTINNGTKEAMLLAGQRANSLNVPVVLDPAGAGATTYRTRAVRELLSVVKFDLIRCNPGELAAIAGVEWLARGVDSGSGEMNIAEVAKQIALQYNCLVAVTGATDYLTDGTLDAVIHGGAYQMTLITGAGCLLSAICAAALAGSGSTFDNIKRVLSDFKKVAERADEHTPIGSFQTEIINQLYYISRGSHL